VRLSWAGIVALTACVLSTCALPVAAAEVGIQAGVDKNRVALGETFSYTLTVSGGLRNLPQPTLPTFDHFEIVGGPMQSQQFSMGTGGISSSLTLTYYLRPVQAGTFTIGPAEITVNGQTPRSEAIRIEVVDVGRTGQPQQQPRPQAEDEASDVVTTGEISGDIALLCSVDNPDPYVGQAVLYRWRLYLSQRARNALDHFNPIRPVLPSFTGFWHEEVGEARETREQHGGQVYTVVEIQRALYPIVSGPQTIEPGKCELRYDNFGFFSRRRAQGPGMVQSEPIEINVHSLPQAGRPKDFGHLVGVFQMRAEVDRTQVRAGEPLTYTVQISGQGNLKALPELDFSDLEKAGFRVYTPEVQRTIDNRTFPTAGNIATKVLLIPREPGEYVIPPRTLTFFDPGREKYHTVRTAAFTITATPGERTDETLVVSSEYLKPRDVVRQTSDDIHYLFMEFKPASNDSTLLYERTPVRIALILPPVLLLGTIFLRRRLDRLSADTGYARRRFARRNLQKALEHAERALRAGREEVFYAELPRAVFRFLADHFNLAWAGLTTADVRELLAERDVPEEDIQSIVAMLEICDLRRFGSDLGGAEMGEAKQILQQTKKLLDKIITNLK
jgi:hypothetical protein